MRMEARPGRDVLAELFIDHEHDGHNMLKAARRRAEVRPKVALQVLHEEYRWGRFQEEYPKAIILG